MSSFFKLLLLISTIAFNIINCTNIDDDTNFVNKVVLRKPDQYILFWNYTDTDVIFKCVVKTTGWIGFGLSPNGGMFNSDMILAWFAPDSTEKFIDAHVEPNNHLPVEDKVINWKKMYMSQKNGFTTVIFTRKIKICHDKNSKEINIDLMATQPIIFSWGIGFKDMAKTFPIYHGENRGSKVLAILGSLNQKVEMNMDEIDYRDFRVNTRLKNHLPTEYYCTMFKLPTEWTDIKQHVIRYETLTSEKNLKYIHHWLMKECSEEYETIYLKQNNYTTPTPDTCSTGHGQWGQVEKYCTKISLAWAIGGELQVVIPPEYGYPIGGSPKEFKYFFIQMHYENPQLDQNFVENSGIRLYATKKLRPIEFGILTTGAISNTLGLSIPPKVKHLAIDNICRKKFMNELYKETGNITIFAELPHTHLSGTGFYSKILKNNKEIDFISNNKYYDSNYQYVNFLPEKKILKKNDEIIVSCVFNTEDRNKFTYGGLRTHDEMCLNFIWYYPRNTEYTQCLEETQVDSWIQFFGLLKEKGYLKNWHVWPKTFFQDTFNDVLQTNNLNSSELENLFQEFYLTSNKMQYVVDNRKRTYYDNVKIERLVEDNECKIDSNMNPKMKASTKPANGASKNIVAR